MSFAHATRVQVIRAIHPNSSYQSKYILESLVVDIKRYLQFLFLQT